MGKKGKKVRPQYVAKANRKKEPMSKKTKIGLLAGGGLLLLCIILFIVLYDDGSLPVRNGVIADKQDNWIISKLQTASSEKYFKLGEVSDPLDGFEIDPEGSIKADTNESAFWYKPIDPDSQIDGYYISGVASNAEDMVIGLPLQLTYYYPNMQFSEPGTVEIAGQQAHYLISMDLVVAVEEETPETEDAEAAEETTGEDAAQSETALDEAAPESATEPEEEAPQEESAEQSDDRTATQQILCYVPTLRNSCILISVTLRVDDEMPEWTEEALLEMVQRISETVVLEK